jgi:hypothetical protein
MSQHTGGHGPRDLYEQRVDRFAGICQELAGQSRRISHLRAIVFAALVAIGLVIERRPGPLSIAAGLGLFALFVFLVVRHSRLRQREEWYRQLVAVNREGLHRLDRAWDELPRHSPVRDVSSHPYAADLDLFGRASLTQILGPVGSAIGAATLESWLLRRGDATDIPARQAAVRELAPLHDLREALAINGRRTRAVRQQDVDRFLRWAESGTWLTGRSWLVASSWLLPLATWTLLILHIAGVIGSALWLVPVLMTAVLYFTTGNAVRRLLDGAFGREGMFAHYPELIRLITAASFTSALLQQEQARLRQEDEPADAQLGRLRRLMHLADLRLSSLHFPVYLVTAWDVHILGKLERWQAAAGHDVRDWLNAVGEFEALAAIATLAHDQPDWTFPLIDPAGEQVLRATALGHPLLAEGVRVTNDVAVGPPGSFLLVTGSNMSGKSTLLRSIGINAVLAQAGAPVCAAAMSMPSLDVHTSIRVQDSLARGVSYFMAELERLKQIVDAAQEDAGDEGVTLLFLLDEILHGTNTAERRIAARRVIRFLVDAGAIGVVTTHDLELAEETVLAPAARLVHFRESFADDSGDAAALTFDYQLREGIATSTNALVLMKLVGLPDEDSHVTHRPPPAARPQDH